MARLTLRKIQNAIVGVIRDLLPGIERLPINRANGHIAAVQEISDEMRTDEPAGPRHQNDGSGHPTATISVCVLKADIIGWNPTQ